MRTLFALAVLAALACGDFAVAVHGTTLEGALRVDGEQLVVTRDGVETRHPLADFCLVERADGTFVWAPGFDDRLRGYVALARVARRKQCVALLERVVAARDGVRARALFERAEKDGHYGDAAEAHKRAVTAIRDAAPDLTAEQTAAFDAEAAALDLVHADLLLVRAARAADEVLSLSLLREALRSAPSHAGALALLKERAPAAFPVDGPRYWLDWRLDLEPLGARPLPADAWHLKRMRVGWRDDIYGFDCGPLRIVTPVRDTRVIRRCLAHGLLTLRVLGELFKTERPRKRVGQRLSVILYGNVKEFRQSARGRGHAWLSGAVGYYSSAERLSRVYWASDPVTERHIAATFVHELTHHWLQEANPRYSDVELRPRGALPGAWIDEGFATLMGDGRYDIATGAWALFDRRSRSLDIVVALARSKKLTPWATVYSMTYPEFIRQSQTPNITFTRRWAAGPQALNRVRLFYEQSAATCMFLYHGEGGRYRERLMQFVVDRYTGKRDKLTIDAAFGMTPAELGAKVEAFARKVASGWQPPR